MEGSKVDDEFQRNINESDWICSDSQCANVNFARRNSCNRCGKDRSESAKKKKLGQEIGKVAAEKSRGLFSADDWQCSKCGNVNWARRQQCNMCNAPKFGEVEERTGYGGGYNDRGVVEYKERRDDDDDEYDEFGRRKKKRRTDSKSEDDLKESKVSNYLKRKSKKDEDNVKSDSETEERHSNTKEKELDEDDDDDDDEDLSKYDLTAWDDLSSSNQKASNGNAETEKRER